MTSQANKTSIHHCHRCKGEGKPQLGELELFCSWCGGKGFLDATDYARLMPPPEQWCGVRGKKQKMRHFVKG